MLLVMSLVTVCFMTAPMPSHGPLPAGEEPLEEWICNPKARLWLSSVYTEQRRTMARAAKFNAAGP